MAVAAVHEQMHKRAGEQDQIRQPAEQTGQVHTMFENKQQDRQHDEAAENPFPAPGGTVSDRPVCAGMEAAIVA